MIKRSYNIDLVKGDTFDLSIQLKDATTRAPLNLASMEFSATLGKSGQPLLDFTVEKSGLGEVTVSLTDEQTNGLETSKFLFDSNVPITAANAPYTWALKRIDGGKVTTLLAGVVNVSRVI